MRTKGVRLALYDEPSASLDPKAEFGKNIDFVCTINAKLIVQCRTVREAKSHEGTENHAVYYPVSDASPSWDCVVTVGLSHTDDRHGH